MSDENASENEKSGFIREMKLMAELKKNANVIEYFGQVSIGNQLLIATEFSLFGNLHDYIRQVRWLK